MAYSSLSAVFFNSLNASIIIIPSGPLLASLSRQSERKHEDVYVSFLVFFFLLISARLH
jgi:hypothetical protein